jgi:hypothetical protein
LVYDRAFKGLKIVKTIHAGGDMRSYFSPRVSFFSQQDFESLRILYLQSAALCPTSHQFEGQLDSSDCTGGPPAALDVYTLTVQEPDTNLRITVFNASYNSLVRLLVAGNFDCVKFSQTANQAVLLDSGNLTVQNRAYQLEIRTSDPTAGTYSVTIESDKPICLEETADNVCVDPPLNNPCNIPPGDF